MRCEKCNKEQSLQELKANNFFCLECNEDVENQESFYLHLETENLSEDAKNNLLGRPLFIG